MDQGKPEQEEQNTLVAASGEPQSQKGLLARLRSYFLGGILITAPITLTVYLSWVFLNWVDTGIDALLPPEYNPNTYLSRALHFDVPGIGLVIVGAFFITAGWFASNIFGRLFVRISEFFVRRMPVVRGLYSALKQIFETVMTSQSKAFREVVMVEFPSPGVWALGFVTGVTKGEVQRLTDSEVINVFVPTTPNPTSGFLMFYPQRKVFYLDMTVEEALKMIVSGGLITPPDRAAATRAP